MMAPADVLIMPMTWASLPDLATKSTPVTPAAPLLFSTTTDWPRRLAMPSARWRPNTSDGPPAGKGMTRGIDLVGNAAWASALLNGRAASPARTARPWGAMFPPIDCRAFARRHGNRPGHGVIS